MIGTHWTQAEFTLDSNFGPQEAPLNLLLNPGLPFAKLYTFLEARLTSGVDYHVCGSIEFSDDGSLIAKLPVCIGRDSGNRLAGSITNIGSTVAAAANTSAGSEAVQVCFSGDVAGLSDAAVLHPNRIFIPNANKAVFKLEAANVYGAAFMNIRLFVGVLQTIEIV